MTAWINGRAGPRHRAAEHRRQLAVELIRRRTTHRGACGPPAPAASPAGSPGFLQEGCPRMLEKTLTAAHHRPGRHRRRARSSTGCSTRSPSCCRRSTRSGSSRSSTSSRPTSRSRLPDLPGRADVHLQLQDQGRLPGRDWIGLRELHGPADQRRRSSRRCSTRCSGSSSSPSPCVVLGLLVGAARRPARRPGRERGQDAHLHADGDQHGRRGHGLGTSSTTTARRASRRSASSTPSSTPSAATRSPGCSRAQLHFNSFLLMVVLLWIAGRLRHGAAVRGRQGRADRHPRGGPHRRRRRAPDLLPGRACRRSRARSSRSSSPC